MLHNLTFAYIDPATTSYLIQIGVGAAIAIGTGFGIIRSKIKKSIRRKEENNIEQIEKKDVTGMDCITADDLLEDEPNEEIK
ncbi:MAG: hypothetical protein IKX54_02330 [Lachnospiraceae bacterium]|nr:hypothetical protein [Lachnospiraceae bacterium]